MFVVWVRGSFVSKLVCKVSEDSVRGFKGLGVKARLDVSFCRGFVLGLLEVSWVAIVA